MSFTAQYKGELMRAIDAIDLAAVDRVIDLFRRARAEDRHIFVCGNGGSASTASHFACDLVKGASYGRDSRFRITALTDALPTLMAYANDVGYETVFVEQLKSFARPGDLVVGISGSGNSPNILRAFEYANAAGCITVALTGRDGGKLGPMAHANLLVPVRHMGRIEDAHLVICHMIGYSFMDTEK